MEPEEDYIYQLRPDIYQVFLRHITQKDVSTAYMKKKIPVVLSHQLDKLKTEGWNLLDIGAGVGAELIPIVQFLNSLGKVKAWALEPSKKLINQCREKATSLGLKNITFINSSWKDYSPDTKFDLIICSHVLYHTEEWEPFILKIVKSLAEGGRAVISLHTRNNIVQKIPVKFLSKIDPKASWERHFHHFGELTDLLDKLGIRYEVDKRKDDINIADCKKMNEEGQKLVEFFLYYPYNKIQEGLRKEIQDYFLSFKEDVIKKEVGFAWVSK